MRLDSVRSLKAQLFDEAASRPLDSFVQAMGAQSVTPRVQAAWDDLGPQEPVHTVASLGVAAGRGRSDYRLSVTVRTPQEAQQYVNAARGEADVVVVPEIKPQPAPGHFRRRLRPMESGVQIRPTGRPWVGTGGFFAVHNATGRYCLVSNEHVLTDFGSVPLGTAVAQPSDGPSSIVGTVGRRIPRMVGGARNKVDAAFAYLSADGDFWRPPWTEMRRPRLDDLGRECIKHGRTTGTTRGIVRAVEKDALVVGTDRGLVWFDDQGAFVGVDGSFSQPGDSGSAITVGSDLVWLLHAGGPDVTGVDWTYACQVVEVCKALDVTPVLAEAA